MSDFSAVYLYKGWKPGSCFQILISAMLNILRQMQSTSAGKFSVPCFIHLPCFGNLGCNSFNYPERRRYIRSQFEVASMFIPEKIWGTLVFRDPAVWEQGLVQILTGG